MRALLILSGLLATAAPIFAQDEVYTFEPLDGYDWPAQIDDDYCLGSYEFPYNGRTEVCNYTNDPVMIGSNYLATGNASLISGNAMWGNPSSGAPLGDPYLEFNLYDFFEYDYDPETDEEILISEVTAVSFDFAWATSAGDPANPPDIEYVLIEAYGYDGESDFAGYTLTGTFTHGIGGTGVGFQGNIVLSELANIESFTIHFENLAPPGSQAEFAIDNFEIYTEGGPGGPGGGGEIYPIAFGPNPNEIQMGYGTSVLKGAGPWGFQGGVRNNTGSAAVFTSTFTSPHPELYDPSVAQHTNQPIADGEIYYPGTEWEINTNTAPSGEYSGSHTVINNSDPSDPDNTFPLISLRLFDPPALTDNTSTAIDPAGVDQITMSNAAAGPHAGALRASVRVASLAISDPRFSMTGIGLTDLLDPGQVFTGTVAFDSTGLPPGSYSATLTLGLEMKSVEGFGINQSQSVADRVWNLQATVGSGVVTVTVNTGEPYATSGLMLGSASTGFALADGTSGSDQTLTAVFNKTPPASGGVNFINSAIDIDFSTGSGLYVMAITFLDGDIPLGFTEQDLAIYTYDTGGSAWVPAIDLNSNGGASPVGAAPFVGSYADYLASLGGGVFDAADLSAFGVDPITNTAWVVLDHASTFRLGTGEGSLAPETFGITEAGGTYTITYQSFAGEVFAVKGSTDLVSEIDLPDTEVGDDSIKTYTHTPPAGSGRYFYRLLRNP